MWSWCGVTMALCNMEGFTEKEFCRFRELVVDKTLDINFPALLTKYTPLLALCRFNKSRYLYRCLQMFMAREDIDLSSTTHYGHNCVTLLCRYYPNNDLIKCLRLLIQHGINCNVLDRNRRPSYLLLCESYHGDYLIDVARLLIKSVDTVDPEAAGKSLTALKNRGLIHESEILFKLIQSMREKSTLFPNEVQILE